MGAGSADAGPAPSFWDALPRYAVMGILNATPDSFSDGGRHLDPPRAIEAGLRMVAEGAALLDIGGESTKPGAEPITPEEEVRRVLPVIRGLRDAGVPLSVDTRNAATMAAALDAGATVVNDVTALTHDPAALPLVARRGCPVVLMHMRGTPETMNSLTQYDDVVADVQREIAARLDEAVAAGVDRRRVALDPGIGFAKDLAGNVALLRGLATFRTLGCPILAGVSRKRFIGTLSGVDDPAERLPGSLAAGLFALQNGARVLRVHDVGATMQAIRVWQALAR